ncbi:hypothetical protein D1007_46026 [Hordeum vulgare]|nr:hypothetical protein D1007_46026 [Hordeum vulgare]
MAVDKPGGSGGGGASSSPASTTDRTTSSRSCSAGTTSASSPPPTYTRIPPHQLTVPDGIPEPSPSPGWGGQGADKAKGLPEVKNSYASVDEYLGVFEPLLFRGGGGGGGGEDVEIRLDGQRGAVRSCAESEGFHKLSMLVSDGLRDIVSLSENDLLLLSKEKMCTLSTILWQYSRMHSVASHPFKDLILSASENNRDGDDQNRAWNVPQPLMGYLKTNLNGSQLNAVTQFLIRDNADL